MTCPYCLALTRDAGVKKVNQPPKNLVSPFWEYEYNEGWAGFSPAISGLLEASYMNWTTDRTLMRKSPQVKQGRFIYTVDFACMSTGHPQHQEGQRQNIRRVGVETGDAAKAAAAGKCTIDQKLYKEFQSECEELRAEIAQVKQARSKEQGEYQQQLAKLEAEMQRLHETCTEQQAELEQLRQCLVQERETSAQIRQHLSTILPGSFVSVAASPTDQGSNGRGVAGHSLVGRAGRVRSIEGPLVAVDFPDRRGAWLPQETLRSAPGARLLMCPGTRVEWHDGTSDSDGGTARMRGVVCDSIDGVTVHVLGADGQKRVRDLWSLTFDAHNRLEDLAPEVGDLVRIHGAEGHAVLLRNHVPVEIVGMVVWRDGGSCSVRFVNQNGDGHIDVNFEASEGKVWRDEAADCVRPGAAVRYRGQALSGAAVPGAVQANVGFVYATHADGTAVVDFLGSLGFRCNAAYLEVVEAPATVDHDLLRLISECFSWSEVCLQYGEEFREEGLLRMISALPPSVVPSDSAGSASGLTMVELDCQTDMFRFVAQAVAESLANHSLHQGGDGRSDPPLLSIDRIEAVRNSVLEHAYEIQLKRLLAACPHGCQEIPGVAALPVRGARGLNEFFLWRAMPVEAVKGIGCNGVILASASKRGDSSGEARCLPAGTGERLAESASGAELHALRAGGVGDPHGTSCLLLARVLLGESLPVGSLDAVLAEGWPVQSEGGSHRGCDSLHALRRDESGALGEREYVVQSSTQVLPLFQIFYRHEATCVG